MRHIVRRPRVHINAAAYLPAKGVSSLFLFLVAATLMIALAKAVILIGAIALFTWVVVLFVDGFVNGYDASKRRNR